MSLGADYNSSQRPQRVDAIFTLTPWYAPQSQCLLEGRCQGFVADAQGTFLDHLTWAARGVCVLDRTVTIRGMVLGRLSPPAHCTDCGLRHALSLSLSV